MIYLVFSEMPFSSTSIITLVTIVGDISMHLVHVIFKVLFELSLITTYFTRQSWSHCSRSVLSRVIQLPVFGQFS